MQPRVGLCPACTNRCGQPGRPSAPPAGFSVSFSALSHDTVKLAFPKFSIIFPKPLPPSFHPARNASSPFTDNPRLRNGIHINFQLPYPKMGLHALHLTCLSLSFPTLASREARAPCPFLLLLICCFRQEGPLLVIPFCPEQGVCGGWDMCSPGFMPPLFYNML